MERLTPLNHALNSIDQFNYMLIEEKFQKITATYGVGVVVVSGQRSKQLKCVFSRETKNLLSVQMSRRAGPLRRTGEISVEGMKAFPYELLIPATETKTSLLTMR